MIKNIANMLTSFRIPGSILLLFFPVFSETFYIIYLLCGFSDMIDGTIARKTNSISEFGSKLDTAADFVFITVSLVKMLPAINIPQWLWVWIGAIAVIKISNITLGYIFQKQFTSLHTKMNKITGLLLFLFPLTLSFVELKYSSVAVCSIATFAAIQETVYITRLQEKIMIIEADRLFLREMTVDDFDALYKVLSDPYVMQYYPHPFNEEEVAGWITRNIERYRTFGFGLWAVCLKDTGEVIGDCGLTMQLINGSIKPEIGYHIRADKQRNGFAKEAAIAVRDWTFKNTPFNMIFSYMKADNTASSRTALAYGCKQTDEFTDKINGTTKVFAISRDEWTHL